MDRVISVPDSIVQTLTYYSDPLDKSSSLSTCDWECPLSNNSSVLYEDFLFANNTNITGFQIDIDGWYGSGGGLHQVSLLSNGAYSYAIDSLNGNASTTCSSGVAAQAASSSTLSGTWTQQTVSSDVNDVDTSVLTADVAFGTSSNDSPSITFSPSIVANGVYDAYLLTPGCSSMGDCSARTSVDIIVDSGLGLTSTITTTISQTNTADETSLIYSGQLTAGATFQLRLSSTASGSGSSSQYQIVANKIQIVAQNTNGSALQKALAGRGLFEYIPAGSEGVFGNVAAASSESSVTTSSLTNATAFDQLSTLLSNATNLINAFIYTSNAMFFAGSFSASGNITTSNIAAYTSSSSIHVPAGGLNGPVLALLDLDGYLYAAGTFTASNDNSVTELGGITRWEYSVSGTSWLPLTGGDVPTFRHGVLGLAATQNNGNDGVLVSGSSSGVALYDVKSSSWDSSSNFMIGSLSTITSATSKANAFIAGYIEAAYDFAATGTVRLITNSSGYPSIVPYDVSFSTPTSSSTPKINQTRRHLLEQEFSAIPPLGLSRLVSRTSSKLDRRTSATVSALPTPIDTTANNQILTGAFYSNHSDHVIILGGRFTSNGASNIGSYSTSQSSLYPLNTTQTIDGAVQTMAINEDTLFIGGNFTTSSGSNAFAIYNLKAGQWGASPAALQRKHI